MKNTLKNLLIFIILLLSFIIIFSINWLYNNFGNVSLEEIMFQIRVPMTDANTDYYYDYAKNALPYILLCTIATFVFITKVFKKRIKPKKAKGKHAKDSSNSLVIYKKPIDKSFLKKFALSFVILIASIVYMTNRTGLIKFIKNQISESSLIKDEYVDVSDVELQFPETKRNLIYIFLESMESTYYSQENGGFYETSLVQDLEDMAIENVAFSNSDTLKGLYALPGSTWTTGGMTAQTTGLPLKLPIDGNSYGDYISFLPGVSGLGDILEKQGYKQMLMLGSNAHFGGRDNLFKQHGNFEIFDFSTAISEGKKKEEDFIWWGYPDIDLFEYAKEKITELSESGEPFNFITLTADTHAPNGYPCRDCTKKFDEHYFNVADCSATRIKNFVEWVKEQDFYENTTIVICGDHTSMQPATFVDVDESGYERTVLNMIINPVEIPENTKNKYGSTMDMFPTTLASLGIKIEGEKLGLGTNLFSNKETLIKKYGLEYVKEELNKNSKFYNDKFIYHYK